MQLFFAEAAPESVRFFTEAFPDHHCHFDAEPFSLERVPKDAEVISVEIHAPITGAVMDALPNLKLITTRSTGFEHIDVAEAAKRGIPVCNVPTYGAHTVAEHTFALLLSLARHLHQAYRRVSNGDFTLDGLLGFDLAGKRLGVIGAGLIGQHVVKIGIGFGMKVVAYDPFARAELADLLGFRYVGLEELLTECDAIALCCPLTAETKHLMNRDAFSKMKKGALLVNTARGGIVDTEALLWALNEGILDGAGLDVLEGEEFMAEDAVLGTLLRPVDTNQVALIAGNLALMRHPRVIVTPHMAFFSREALQRIRQTTADSIRAFMAGRDLNLVKGSAPTRPRG